MAGTDPSWLPTPDAVAAVIARFLPDRVGAIDGGWSDDASPTQAQVATLISNAGRAVAAGAAGGVSADLEPVAAEAVKYLAGAEIVLAFFPEADLDYVRMLRSWADGLLAKLGIVDTGGGGGVDVTPATPVGYYPQVPPLPCVW